MPEGTEIAEQRWFNRKQAADYLTEIGCPITKRTLEKLASNNNALKGPPFTRAGWRTVRYDRADLDAWAAKQTTRIE